jgi:poly-gamma-glutamate capsule biosynthesis protein CapA/YwtB (metallophosphatase superfamily)
VRRYVLPVVLGASLGVVAFVLASRPHRAPAAMPLTTTIAPQPKPKPKPKPRPVVPIELADVGDMTFGTAGVTPPGGARALLARVARSLRSDFTVGNLETTLGSGGSAKCAPHAANCFSFQAPAVTALALKRAGFGAVNLANNHADDYGADGQAQTGAALRAAHLPYTGRPGRTTYVKTNGVKLALLGFAPYDYDDDLLDVEAAAARVRAAATKADLVVVFIHAGAEGAEHQHVGPGMETYLGEPRGDAIRFAHAVVAAGADLVLGSGPHVLRAMEWYRGRLIAYSLGNFTGYHTLGIAGPTSVSGILRVTLGSDGSFVAGTLIPVRLVGTGTPTLDRARTAIATLNALARGDFPKSGVRLSPTGRLERSRAPDPAARAR